MGSRVRGNLLCGGLASWAVVVACGNTTETGHRTGIDGAGEHAGGAGGADSGGSAGSDQAGGRSSTGGAGGGDGFAGTAGRATGGAGGFAMGGAGGVSRGGAGGTATGGAGMAGSAAGGAGGASTGGTGSGGASTGGAGTGGAGGCISVQNGSEAGTWVEVAHIPCNGGAEHPPEFPIREFILEWGGGSNPGRFKVTWHPFETYIDYSGSYTLRLEPAVRTPQSVISMTSEGGAYVPEDRDAEGTISRCGEELVLRNMWLGTDSDAIRRVPPPPPECGHRFRRRSAAD